MNEDCPSPMQELAPKQLVKPDLTDGLKCRKVRLEQQLSDVNAAIAALEANPEITKVLELVGKASRY